MSWYFAWQRDDPHSNDWEPPYKPPKTTKLTPTEIYKDGGSISYVDKKGNKYWRNFKFRDKYKKNYTKLYKGDINSKNPELASGQFLLLGGKYYREDQIITQ